MTASRWILGGPFGALARGAGASLVLAASLLLGGCVMDASTEDGQTVSEGLTTGASPAVEVDPTHGGVADEQVDPTNPGAPRMESGGPGNGPDPLPWRRELMAAEPGPGDGPDPLPWMHNTSVNAAVTTAK